MTERAIFQGVFGWFVILLLLFWYVNKNRHPEHKPLLAFGIFIGIFFGILFLTLIIVVGAIYGFELEQTNVSSLIGSLVGLSVVIPTWRKAMAIIKRPPKHR